MIKESFATGKFRDVNKIFAQYYKRMRGRFTSFLLRLSGRASYESKEGDEDTDGDENKQIENKDPVIRYNSREKKKANQKSQVEIIKSSHTVKD